MKVSTYCINKGQPSQYFGLKNAEENQVLHAAPNNWKTEKGALNWAKKHGYDTSKGAKMAQKNLTNPNRQSLRRNLRSRIRHRSRPADLPRYRKQSKQRIRTLTASDVQLFKLLLHPAKNLPQNKEQKRNE